MNQFPVKRENNHCVIRCKYRKTGEQSLVPEGCPGQFHQILCCILISVTGQQYVDFCKNLPPHSSSGVFTWFVVVFAPMIII